jgi:lipoic acid synthetase
MLRIRWLGRVPYAEALALQHGLFDNGSDQHLLLLEHPHVFTHGPNADLATNLRCEPLAVGAELVAVRRGGDITYHGPGQLVGYPLLTLPGDVGAAGHVAAIEQLIIDALGELGLDTAGRFAGFPGVWIDPEGPNPRKICAIGVRLSRGRTMHGFALNVATDLTYLREHIVPCGIAEHDVTSLAEEGLDVEMATVVEVIARLAAHRWGEGIIERQDVAWRHRVEDLSAFSRGEGPGDPVTDGGDHMARTEESAAPSSTRSEPVRLLGRLAQAGVTGGLEIAHRKPEWLRPKVRLTPEVLGLRRTLRELDLVTVCEEAGCPNLSECWSDGTATFMVLGERCTRACGFCLVDTRRPEAPADDEPGRVAEAVERLGLRHAVLTMVARDDLADGGMAHVARCVEAIRERCPHTAIETLISDAKGDAASLEVLFAARPDVLNHNIETVARLQRAVRPSASYARSLAVLSMAKTAGLTTKSGMVLGMGESVEEVDGCLADLAAIGVDIVTLGQYLRPTSNHLPVARFIEPVEFDRWKRVGEEFGIGHVEASPLTRSSYHARQAAERLDAVPVTLSAGRLSS